MTSKKQETAIGKYLRGQLTKEKLDILFEGLSDEEIRKHFEKTIEVDYLLSVKYVNVDSDTAYRDFLSKVRSQRTRKSRGQVRNMAFMKYAAMFIGLIGLAYISMEYYEGGTVQVPSLEIENEPITIQLDNGKVKEIDEDDSAEVLNEEGHRVATQEEDKIIYKGNSNSGELVYNKLNIPYGKKFEIELSDGTIVYLNSGSSLRYPVNFLKGQDRQVFVKGEAYFKVAEDAERPFIVNTRQVNIKVLGTEFNVSSYKEDEEINTVLVSGKVQLYSTYSAYDPNTSFKIAPKQMGVWNKGQKRFDVLEVNTEVYTAWMKGSLVFRNMPFKTIRKKLERHYNVTIINGDKILDENTFNAVFDIENIQEVLETFDRNFGIKYKIINNQIIIQPKNKSI